MYTVNSPNFAFAETRMRELDRQAANLRGITWRAAQRTWEHRCMRGKLGRIWAFLTGRKQHLLDPRQLRCTLCDQHFKGIETVPLAKIIGSEGRSRDFDRGFNPLNDSTRERWLHVYSAMSQELGLPLVTLIEIGGMYFVRDGHHRISVARALGKLDIDAEVTVWEAAGPLPWRPSVADPDVARQPAGMPALA